MNAIDRPVSAQAFGACGGWEVAVAIPARNEERRIAACLTAVATSLGRRGGIVLNVNGSDDETAATAARWFEQTGASGVVLEDPYPPARSGVGQAHRVATEMALSCLGRDGVVLITDGDTAVAPDWVTSNIIELAHADLICGRILVDPEEFSTLPTVVADRAVGESEYLRLTIALREALDPLAHDPLPEHLSAGGASLAFRAPLYHAVGGFPDVVEREDRLFAEAAEAQGLRVRHSSLPRVVASCRLTGRTPGGMSGTLRTRVHEPDPFCDELLEPARITERRMRLRGEARRRWSGTPRDFAAAWARTEAADETLRCQRLRLSDLQRELPILRDIADALMMEPVS